MKQNLKQPIIIFTILTVAAGFMLTVAFNSLAPYNTAESANNEYKKLTDFIIDLEEKNAETENKILRLRNEITSVQNEQSKEEGLLLALQKKFNEMALTAGYVEATGAGLIISLDDNTDAAIVAQKNSPETYKAENFIIHDSDLLYILKALAPYTEAAAINGQRIIDTSHIRCVGTVIMVNSVRLAPPYLISVIGNPEALNTALHSSGTFLYLTEKKDMPVTVTIAEDIILPASGSSFMLTYTKAAQISQ